MQTLAIKNCHVVSVTDNKKWLPKEIAIIQQKLVLSEILDIITINQVKKKDTSVLKKTQENINFINT